MPKRKSDQISASASQPFLPFWNQKISPTLSAQLWMPSVSTIAEKTSSWYTKRVTCDLPASTNLRIPQTQSEPAKVRGHKIRLHPTKEQKELLKHWIAGAQACYNMAVEHLNKQEDFSTVSKLSNAENLIGDKEWIKAVPAAIRQDAIQEAIESIKKLYKQRQKKQEPRPPLKFRRKEMMMQQTIIIRSQRWNNGIFYRNCWKKVGIDPQIRGSEALPQKLTHDATICRTKLGHYYINIIQDIPSATAAPPDATADATHPQRILSIDTGVRVFAAAYDANRGVAYQFGAGDIARIERLCHHYDRLRQKSTLVNHRRRFHMRRAALRIQLKIRRLVDDLHCKLANWICKNYDVVLIPPFPVQRMTKKAETRHMNSKTARNMYSWSHYRFRQRLLYVATKFGCDIQVVDESYTSKTCGRCGVIHEKLGGKKIFECMSCGLVSDRDLHAARNILLKYLTEKEH